MSEQINCLRCHCCSLLPESDLKSPLAVIWCEKQQSRSPLILSGCGLANPDQRYKKINGKTVKLDGDKTKNSSAVEKEYLRLHYATTVWSRLVRITGRDRLTLIGLGNRLGLQRCKAVSDAAHAQNVVNAKIAMQKQGRIFNAAQSEYIETCHRTGYWPTRHFGREPEKSRSEEVRSAIMARVKELDAKEREWSWESIVNHMKWVSPGYRRKTKFKNKKSETRERKRCWANQKRQSQKQNVVVHP